jgi:Hypothetical methyltransferase
LRHCLTDGGEWKHRCAGADVLDGQALNSVAAKKKRRKERLKNEKQRDFSDEGFPGIEPGTAPPLQQRQWATSAQIQGRHREPPSLPLEVNGGVKCQHSGQPKRQTEPKKELGPNLYGSRGVGAAEDNSNQGFGPSVEERALPSDAGQAGNVDNPERRLSRKERKKKRGGGFGQAESRGDQDVGTAEVCNGDRGRGIAESYGSQGQEAAKVGNGDSEGKKLSKNERKKLRLIAEATDLGGNADTDASQRGGVPQPPLEGSPGDYAGTHVTGRKTSKRLKLSKNTSLGPHAGGHLGGHQEGPGSKLARQAAILRRHVQGGAEAFVPPHFCGTAGILGLSPSGAVRPTVSQDAAGAKLCVLPRPPRAQTDSVTGIRPSKQRAKDEGAVESRKPHQGGPAAPVGEEARNAGHEPNQALMGQVRPNQARSSGHVGHEPNQATAGSSRHVGQAGGRGAEGRSDAGLAGQFSRKLQGSYFRYLNEQLYTTDGASAYRLMQEQPRLFEEYHQVFPTPCRAEF